MTAAGGTFSDHAASVGLYRAGENVMTRETSDSIGTMHLTLMLFVGGMILLAHGYDAKRDGPMIAGSILISAYFLCIHLKPTSGTRT